MPLIRIRPEKNAQRGCGCASSNQCINDAMEKIAVRMPANKVLKKAPSRRCQSTAQRPRTSICKALVSAATIAAISRS